MHGVMEKFGMNKLLMKRLMAALVLIAAVLAFSQETAPGGADQIIPFLNQTIVWSRQLAVQQQLVSEPSDALFLNDNRQIADQVAKLAFDFARARAQAMEAQAGGSSPSAPAPSQYQRLADSVARADQ